MREYRTKELARLMGVHVNTVRFYEQVGFLTKPARLPNGYRVYTELQLDQCLLIRMAMRAEVIQNGLRKQAVKIVRLSAALEFDECCAAAETYCKMLDLNIGNARAAISAVEDALAQSASADDNVSLKRAEAAKLMNVTPETLRTWERSGLMTVNRLENGYRVYNSADMKRLGIIRTLRCANYSLSAILRLLSGLDRCTADSVEAGLNIPKGGEDIVSVCDHLIESLTSTKMDALEICGMAANMREKYRTIQ